ncbi:MAG: YihY/virulence factor BrkB family protein [Gemmatimonadota bacterium]
MTKTTTRAALKPRMLGHILKTAIRKWDRDDVPRHGAALAYYTLFAMAPLLIIAIGIGGMVFGPEAARGEVVRQIGDLIGTDGAMAIQGLLVQASQSDRSTPATVIGIITFILGATGAFSALQGALDRIWEVTPKPRGAVWSWLRQRILSFGLVLGVGFLLLVSLTLSAAIGAISQYMHARLPGGEMFWHSISFFTDFILMTVMFALIYRVLPDVRLAWRDVWLGSLVTSIFFSVGKFLIGLYLGHASIASTFGAAGSVVIILIWVYYSSQVVLFGAEVTAAWVNRVGAVETGQSVPPVDKELAVRKRARKTTR